MEFLGVFGWLLILMIIVFLIGGLFVLMGYKVCYGVFVLVGFLILVILIFYNVFIEFV